MAATKEWGGWTYRNGGRDDLLPILDEDMDVRVCLGDENRLRAEASIDVKEERAMRQVLPGEPCPTTLEYSAYM